MAPPKTRTVAIPSPSQVRSFSYDHAASTLTVRFRSSPKPYVHTGVPEELFHAWRQWNAAGYSPGGFYHSHVKRYPLRPDTHFDRKPA